MLRRLLLPAAFCALWTLPRPALADDAVVRGGASGLISLNGAGLALQSESLQFAPLDNGPCYELAASSQDAAFLAPGAAVPCDAAGGKSLLRPRWRVTDVYEFAPATAPVDAVFALPVTAWTTEGSSKAAASGSAGLQASVDADDAGPAFGRLFRFRGKDTYGWTFRASLAAGKPHTVRVAYDFDIEYLGPASQPHRRLRYVFSAGRSWDAAPKASIAVQTGLPAGLPEIAVPPPSYLPSCVGRRSMAFSLDASSLRKDFELVYPEAYRGPGFPPSAAEFDAWRQSLGSPVLSCDLSRRLMLDGGRDIQAKLSAERCVPSCASPPVR